MRSIMFSFGLFSLLLSMAFVTACDQGTSQPNKPAAPQSGSSSTSSDRKETHPEQPTGKPQSGEVTQPAGAPLGR